MLTTARFGWKNRKSPLKGVRLDKRNGYYYAQIGINGRNTTLPGRYDTAKEAHTVYIAAARKYFGKFARFD
jgi:hypothetical protein